MLAMFPYFSGTYNASDCVAIERSLHGLTDWRRLGYELGLKNSSLNSIGKRHGNNVEKCKAAMLHSWLKTGKATNGKLVNALRRMGEDNVVDKLVKSKGTLNFKIVEYNHCFGHCSNRA